MTLWDTRPMSDQPLDLSRTWTESEYLALGELDIRTELIDGKIVVSPPPDNPHQAISLNLTIALKSGARAVGLRALEAIGVRLRPGTIVVPDIVIGKLSLELGATDAADVVLVAEVTSPSNAAYDRGPKKAKYESAGIPWYLLVEPDRSSYHGVALHLYRLDGRRYVEHISARYGEPLVSGEPFLINVDTAGLLEP